MSNLMTECRILSETTANSNWDSLSHEEKNHQLFHRQKELLDRFLERGAISQAQYDKSLHDLIEKMNDP